MTKLTQRILSPFVFFFGQWVSFSVLEWVFKNGESLSFATFATLIMFGIGLWFGFTSAAIVLAMEERP